MNRRRWSPLMRWGIFNAVGVVGFGLQLMTLFLLKRVAGLDYRVATGCAVEIAVLHNFVWHECVTWADVVSHGCAGICNRLLRFHAANGMVSLFGNTLVAWLLVSSTGMSYLLANVLGVVICSVLNFAVGDRFVFRSPCQFT